ncbi:family 20 glycosylhydrolase [Mycoplasma sp. CSL7491-lung]|uniref:family 20 glycosylhydrolase n=1 Tax=Mycoplasma sp. CSL7491-lung TaxID=549718 RepID=UPI001C1024F9|nr:family 20 glycosylhydrolase [Mycoplasma sp. CSL7491-lung]MBU4692896.1 family 20 glycosylhydrolase [Mycoplasma sp. CSL7491-lung]
MLKNNIKKIIYLGIMSAGVVSSASLILANSNQNKNENKNTIVKVDKLYAENNSTIAEDLSPTDEEQENLIVDGSTATASSQESNNPAQNAIDAAKASTRWATDQGSKPQYLDVKLKNASTISSFNLLFERDNVREFKIFATNEENTNNIENDNNLIYHYNVDANKRQNVFKTNFTKTVKNAKNIRIRILKYDPDGRTIHSGAGWQNVSIQNFELYKRPIDDFGPTNQQQPNLIKNNATATSPDNEGAGHTPDKVVDSNDQTRWATNKSDNGVVRYIDISLTEAKSISSFRLLLERANVRQFQIFATSALDTNNIENNDNKVYEYNAEGDNRKKEIIQNFTKTVKNAKNIRIKFTNYDAQGVVNKTNWRNISVFSFEAYKKFIDLTSERQYPADLISDTNPNDTAATSEIQENRLKNQAVVASAIENNTLNANKAVDGNRTKPSRWGTPRVNNNDNNFDPEDRILTINLDGGKTLSSFNILFERDNISDFEIYASSKAMDANIENESNKVYSYDVNNKLDDRKKEITANFTKPVINARTLRLKIKNYQSNAKSDHDGWRSAAVIEFEAYKKPIDFNSGFYRVQSTLENWKPTLNEEKTKLILPEGLDNSKLKLFADYEQVIDEQYNVYQPLTDKTVVLDLNYKDGNREFNKTYNFVVPGKHTQVEDKNQKPKVAVEISEWYSDSNEKLTLNEDLKVYFKGEINDKINAVFNELKEDYKELFGKDLEILKTDSNVTNGNILFDLSEKSIGGFDNETYSMNINDNVTIKATDAVGVYWATRTLLQMIKLDPEQKLVKGEMKDYPKFKKRGMSFDVGRKAVSMDILKDIVKQMSWYKMNDFQVHLTDNLIFLEDYYDQAKGSNNALKAYSGWRLESSHKNDEGVTLHNQDYHYTKAEFKNFIDQSRLLGVEIVPELDFPAHAIAFTKLHPELAVQGYSQFGGGRRSLADHIDIRKPEAVKLIKDILDEYVNEGGIFDKTTGTNVHIGADEFFSDHDAYYRFVNDMFKYFKEKEVQVRIWGSFKWFKSNTEKIDEDLKENVIMNIWSLQWADPVQMYKEGYSLIHTLDQPTYIVPNGSGRQGAYNDRFNVSGIYNGYEANVIGGNRIPAGSKQMLGGSFAVWGDSVIDTHHSGLTEYDEFLRIKEMIPYFATRVWGIGDGLDQNFNDYTNNVVNKLNLAPGINPGHEFTLKDYDKQLFNFDLSGKNDNEKLLSKSGEAVKMELGENTSLSEDLVGEDITTAIELKGGNSQVKLGYGKLPFNTKITFKIKRQEVDQPEEILFYAPTAYGQLAIKTKQKDTNKFGFSQELNDYSFDYELPIGEWHEISLITVPNNRMVGIVKLFVDGEEVGGVPVGTNYVFKDGRQHTFNGASSLFIPMEYLGSKENSFKGLIKDLRHDKDFTINKVEKDSLERPEVSLKNTVDWNNFDIKYLDIPSNEEYDYKVELSKVDKDNKIVMGKVIINKKSNPEIKVSKNFILDNSSVTNIDSNTSDNAPSQPETTVDENTTTPSDNQKDDKTNTDSNTSDNAPSQPETTVDENTTKPSDNQKDDKTNSDSNTNNNTPSQPETTVDENTTKPSDNQKDDKTNTDSNTNNDENSKKTKSKNTTGIVVTSVTISSIMAFLGLLLVFFKRRKKSK